MIVLHTMPRIGWGLLAPSPFCAKIELILRMMAIPHRLAPGLSAADAPRKKLPWIEDGALVVADSERIVAHLEATRGPLPGDARLTEARRATLHLARRAAEESLYFVIVAERWSDDAHRRAYARDLTASMPALARPLVTRMAHRMLTQQLWQQGTGRHPLAEALQRGVDDIDAIARVLGDEPWFGGADPVAVDAALWGSLANIWYTPIDGHLKRAVAGHPNLVGWLARVAERYASDVSRE
jgi:glutathione S-transferase